jgi:hypothetical protein
MKKCPSCGKIMSYNHKLNFWFCCSWQIFKQNRRFNAAKVDNRKHHRTRKQRLLDRETI